MKQVRIAIERTSKGKYIVWTEDTWEKDFSVQQRTSSHFNLVIFDMIGKRIKKIHAEVKA